MPGKYRLRLRRDSAAAWAAVNPVLADGEPGLERDTKKVKYGDGSSRWNDLPYAAGGSGIGSQGPAGPPGPQGIPGLLVLGPNAPVPAETPIGTVIFRTK